jgi:hypothetical protein
MIKMVNYSYKCVGQFRIAQTSENDGEILSPASYVTNWFF